MICVCKHNVRKRDVAATPEAAALYGTTTTDAGQHHILGADKVKRLCYNIYSIIMA